jgi:glycosyltransferase involved in cell wall biosynthesis
MNTQPLVSVIIPNYNHAPYLRQRIDSVVHQTYRNFEVIILDDHSTDNSMEIINDYNDNKHISHIVSNEQNTANTFLQWEKGFSLSNGDLIWIAESDDYADVHLLEKAVAEFNDNENVVLTLFHSQLIDADGKEINTDYDKRSPQKKTTWNGTDFVRKRCCFHNSIYNASMTVFKKKAIEQVNPYYLQLKHCGDWAFWTEIAMQGDVVEIPQKLNYYRQHNNNVTKHGIKSEQAFFENAKIMTYLSEKLKLTPYQKKCLKGKMSKKLKNAKHSQKQLIQEFPDIYDGKLLDKIIYTIDKIFDFSSLEFNKQ